MPRFPRPHAAGLPPYAGLARVLAALCVLAPLAAGQFATVQRERKNASGVGGFRGALANDYRFGVSVTAIGDLDGDGVRDLAVGSHRANLGGVERGGVWLLFMNLDGTVREV